MYSLNKAGGMISFGELPSHVRPASITWVPVDRNYVNEEVSWILKLVDVRLIYPVGAVEKKLRKKREDNWTK